MKNNAVLKIVALVVAFFIFLYLIITNFYTEATSPTENTLSAQEKQDGWVLLFDGETTNGWHMFSKPNMKHAWKAVNGELTTSTNDTSGTHGDIVTDGLYENFELVFDWKIAREGNSGVFINVQDDTSYIATWATGPEYQLLDNPNMQPGYLDGGKKGAGALYGLVPLKTRVEPNPAGEWNNSRIMQVNGKINFWLNGVMTCEEQIGSERWMGLVANSKAAVFPDFSKSTKGHIGLQDWAKGVSFRNIKIRII
ncbi:MAG: hypothetical protein B7Y11_10720 [Sphingobacteriia bacterium 24-36-13]|jgi:hypothetical protein|uniref:3-keto-disaccharide hydrolase n=1 Tax=Sediminibacterium sp. TaxID=1917865 RepID=UPI000BD1EFC0|nr:DUF1080 domain-containing protein [Sediminibacterium sp.]OYY08827.1 MAG: hypothetical protein B7Y66_10150 [Sphingobacteriia bacterium 35-36-14]OYZ53194.1 MAG: hypothetical protein B7Y11_10720 [Sphingobacteriia bacterium 24-36-13]OZA65871.1 MAG: hypothetical protein B7X68_02545 [Sphingobacteriia bacterium 39-36-14]HQS24661.1 DUF1080 domain-containing protein [Sediminibacterium sp.]HQS34191.1 DUF1080 domain-containing protein [Sediminibacterium sp.]